MNNVLWSNLLRKTAIKTTFYFATDKESMQKKKISKSK